MWIGEENELPKSASREDCQLVESMVGYIKDRKARNSRFETGSDMQFAICVDMMSCIYRMLEGSNTVARRNLMRK